MAVRRRRLPPILTFPHQGEGTLTVPTSPVTLSRGRKTAQKVTYGHTRTSSVQARSTERVRGGQVSSAQAFPARSHVLHRALKPHLERHIIRRPDIPRQTAILQRDAIGIPKVDGLRPLVVDDIRDFDPLG